MGDWLDDPNLSDEEKLARFKALQDGGEVQFAPDVELLIEPAEGISVSSLASAVVIRESVVRTMIAETFTVTTGGAIQTRDLVAG